MPPQQQAECFLYDHNDDAVVNFDDFTTDYIVGSDDNQTPTATMKGEDTKQAAHRFDLLDTDDERQETNYQTCLFPCLFQFKKKKTISGSILEEGEEEVEEEIENEEIEEVEVERRVRFVEEVIGQQEDTKDGRRSVVASRMLDAVTVIEIEIPHVSDYTPEEKQMLWYTRQEMTKMKQICLHTIRDIITQHQQKYKCSAVESLYCCSFYLRGLEKFIDYHQIMTMNMNHNYICTNSMNYVRQTHKTNVRRYDGIIAVLGEQYQQRVECFQHHGKVQKGLVDPDRLRMVYETEGKTQESI